MPFVKIYQLKNDGHQEVIATCKLEGEVVVCEGDEALIANLERDGIVDYENPGKFLFFKDGRKFLEQLKYNFKSGYLNASDVQESNL